MSKKLAATLAFLCFLVGWFLTHQELYFSTSFIFPRDVEGFHFPAFRFVALYLRHLGDFPEWDYTSLLGIWLAPLANNFLLLMPHRIVGYFLVWAGWDPILAYKISFVVLGQGGFLFGVYLLAVRLFADRWVGYFAVSLALISGLGLGFLHQEQALGTVFYIPFLWWVALDLPGNPWRLPLFSSLLGLSLNGHYPHIIVAYLGAIAIGGVFFFRPYHLERLKKFRAASNAREIFVLLGVSTASLLISAGPLLYSYTAYHGKLISPFRGQTNSLEKLDFETWKEVSLKQEASIRPKNLLRYIAKFRGIPYAKRDQQVMDVDENVLFLSPVIIVSLLLLVFFKVPWRGFQLAILVSLAILMAGHFGPAPRLLWYLMPGISYFRQWYHFVHLFNLHLLFLLIAVGMSLPLRARWIYFLAALVTTLPQSQFVATFIRKEMVPVRELRTDCKFFLEMNRMLLVSPKGLDLDGVFQTYRSPLCALGENSDCRPVNLGEVNLSCEQNRFRLDLPQGISGGRTLAWRQYNDGDWKIVDGEGTKIPMKGAVLEFPLTGRAQSWRIARPKTPWYFFCLAMWVPMMSAIYIARRKVR